jgi:hypothetical protein
MANNPEGLILGDIFNAISCAEAETRVHALTTALSVSLTVVEDYDLRAQLYIIAMAKLAATMNELQDNELAADELERAAFHGRSEPSNVITLRPTD